MTLREVDQLLQDRIAGQKMRKRGILEGSGELAGHDGGIDVDKGTEDVLLDHGPKLNMQMAGNCSEKLGIGRDFHKFLEGRGLGSPDGLQNQIAEWELA
jgi:hypothetical protein